MFSSIVVPVGKNLAEKLKAAAALLSKREITGEDTWVFRYILDSSKSASAVKFDYCSCSVPVGEEFLAEN